ncbi:DUF4760 domain-containing protein [Pseudobutyrivibrio sp.]
MKIQEVISILTNIAILVSVIIAAGQLVLNRKIAKMDFNRRKKQATIEFSSSILNITNELSRAIKKYYGTEPISYTAYMGSDEEANKIIRDYLNLMERLSVGINSQVYDFDILQRICGYKAWEHWEQLKDVVLWYEKRCW